MDGQQNGSHHHVSTPTYLPTYLANHNHLLPLLWLGEQVLHEVHTEIFQILCINKASSSSSSSSSSRGQTNTDSHHNHNHIISHQ